MSIHTNLLFDLVLGKVRMMEDFYYKERSRQCCCCNLDKNKHPSRHNQPSYKDLCSMDGLDLYNKDCLVPNSMDHFGLYNKDLSGFGSTAAMGSGSKDLPGFGNKI
jgi:hypothetical protein